MTGREEVIVVNWLINSTDIYLIYIYIICMYIFFVNVVQVLSWLKFDEII